MSRRQRAVWWTTAAGILVLCASLFQQIDPAQNFIVPVEGFWTGASALLSDLGELGRGAFDEGSRFDPPGVPVLEADDGSRTEPDLEDAGFRRTGHAAEHSPWVPGLELKFTQALGFYKSGDLARGDELAREVNDENVKTALEWVALRRLPRAAGFQRLQAFAAAHPDWPGLPWLRKRSEEALLGDRKSAAVIKSYFANARPETPAGNLALAGVLVAEGKPAEAAALVRSVWREADLNNWLEAKIRSDFGAYLDRADHKFRADRLLYKGQVGAALRAAKLAGADVLALAKARAAVMAEAPDEKLVSAVPQSMRSDPGFLFAQIQRLRRADRVQEAVAILLSSPHEPDLVINGDEWWVERRLLARKLLDVGDRETAYKVCAEHSAMTEPLKIEAEFHAGWIALRFLDDPARAAVHFAKAAALAETPISRARTAYWQGRAAEALADERALSEAKTFYEKAAVHATTYYGQLARAKLGLTTLPIRTISDEAKGDERHGSIRAIELLYDYGETELAQTFAMEAVRGLSQERQVAALASVIAAQGNAQLSLAVGKLASQRGFAIDTLAFPVYGIPAFEPLQNSAPVSVVYSIARQESAFNAKAISSAGAKGLMQMMSATARRAAERASVAFDENRLLTDAAFNARLGAAHLGDLLHEQHGSYILTFAAYNAGGKRVKEWIDAYGDPRKPGVDPIDWIERIPITETRNYVQRVIENLTVYRVRFGEGNSTPGEAVLRTEAKL